MSLEDARRDIDRIRDEHRRPRDPDGCIVEGCKGAATHRVLRGGYAMNACRDHAGAAWRGGMSVTKGARRR